MGTTSSALTSSIPSNSSTFAPVNFTGVSTYSTELQSVLSRAVSIAQLPVTALQNDQADIEDKVQALATLQPDVAAVASDITALGSLSGGQALSATSSDSSVVSATATGATAAGNYSITNVTSVASAASATSASEFSSTATVSSAGNLQLLVGSTPYSFSLASGQNNLQGLVSAINGISGVPVTASILTTPTGDYLTLSANSTGAVTALQLNDIPASGSPVNLLSTTSTGLNLGSSAKFDLDGLPIIESSNTINDVVPGLTFNILAPSAANETITLTLSQDPTNITTALQSFVADYNTLATATNAQTGQSGGALVGDSTIYQIESAMQQAVTYEGGVSGSSVNNLSDLGISIGDTGQMTLDSSVVNAMSSSQISDALTFLGSSTTGLGTIANSFTEISDSVSGVIAQQTTNYNAQDQALQTEVTNDAARINTEDANLQSQLEAADAAIAALQAQQQVLTSSIQAVDLTLYGQNYGSGTPSSS